MASSRIIIGASFKIALAIDKLRGNKLGYGERFDAGFYAMGDLALAIVGIITLPIGCLLGGLTMSITSTPIGTCELVLNLLPVFIYE
ncbi:ethanolamine utilization protein EutH [Ohessyouella blattaphilus]|uniref:Ethanolamine utilization protein EutH n=1 Tax=Ohessyouella blattaphilus TaxID=2949333 RepID=A0ABT1EGL6_9FIRM|nr:ethanolamine utilization protein EutH [Ohessyouella blattaphilus]MCP1109656.1 ethanolamine utilization protein EutH [Ohessyouella blattaphilus]MCR8563050.1 ethanolamine utilization protein EutH [Ohessyouella blattaphilus]MDL2250731.1 ethanolamine utilization protein EutH [Lachnospiraceae bacterium OttesenSCG-928-J05]